jgi:hypothetical protein
VHASAVVSFYLVIMAVFFSINVFMTIPASANGNLTRQRKKGTVLP